MDGILEFVQQPVFALAASVLLLIVSLLSLLAFWRGGRARKARDRALGRAKVAHRNIVPQQQVARGLRSPSAERGSSRQP